MHTTSGPRRERWRLPTLLAAWLAFILPLSLACGAETRLGTAFTDITPPLGIPMAGYYHARGADGVLDPLFSKAIVLERDGERVALVTLDLIGTTRWVTDQARAEIGRTTGLKAESVMISATHAHTGPELADRGERGTDMGGEKEIAVRYTRELPKLIAQSVRLASERLQPARLSAARGRCDSLAFNRRYYMRDGSVGWNPGKLNTNMVTAAGPTDPEVCVLYADAPEASAPGGAIATYVTFAMHPDTTGGSKLSADWPGALGRVLTAYHGSNHLTLLANGTCGNINNFDFSWNWSNHGPFEQNRIGTILGAAVLQAYRDLRPVSAGPLRVRSERVELALPEITPEEAAAAKKTIEETRDDRGANFMKLVRAYRALDVAARAGQPHQVETQVIALGRDVAWVGLPGEVFVELGLAIKKRSPFKLTFVVELANENLGYIPDRRSYAEGNYEPESARCAAGSGEKLVETALRLLAEAYQESPASPRVGQSGTSGETGGLKQ
jgi:neutral ceramidase